MALLLQIDHDDLDIIIEALEDMRDANKARLKEALPEETMRELVGRNDHIRYMINNLDQGRL